LIIKAIKYASDCGDSVAYTDPPAPEKGHENIDYSTTGEA